MQELNGKCATSTLVTTLKSIHSIHTISLCFSGDFGVCTLDAMRILLPLVLRTEYYETLYLFLLTRVLSDHRHLS